MPGCRNPRLLSAVRRAHAGHNNFFPLFRLALRVVAPKARACRAAGSRCLPHYGLCHCTDWRCMCGGPVSSRAGPAAGFPSEGPMDRLCWLLFGWGWAWNGILC